MCLRWRGGQEGGAMCVCVWGGVRPCRGAPWTRQRVTAQSIKGPSPSLFQHTRHSPRPTAHNIQPTPYITRHTQPLHIRPFAEGHLQVRQTRSPPRGQQGSWEEPMGCDPASNGTHTGGQAGHAHSIIKKGSSRTRRSCTLTSH